jgi:ribosome recycling factor
VAVRNERRDANDALKKQEKAGELTEDDLKNELDEIQKKADKSIKEIDETVAEKEKEIMEV